MLLFAALLVMPGNPVSSNMTPPGIFGTFAKFQADTEDVGGYEVVVLPGFDHPNVVFTCAAGDVEPPVLVPVTVAGKDISFDVPDAPGESCGGHYVARLKGNALMLTNGGETVRLPRRRANRVPKVDWKDGSH